MKKIFIGAAIIAFVLVLFFAFSLPRNNQKLEPSSLTCQDCNLVLIMMHGFRFDHLSSFGYFRPTSPNIDRIVKEGLTYDSLISRSSDFTVNQKKIISYDKTGIINFLKSRGYKTAGFFDGRKAFNWLSSYPFDTFDNFPKTPILKEKFSHISKFVEENKNNKFFILVSSFEVHHPNRYPPSFYKKFDPNYSGVAEKVSLLDHWHRLDNGLYASTIDLAHSEEDHKDHLQDGQAFDLNEKDIKNLVARYDEAIFHFDELVGEILQELKTQGLDKKTIVAITSDVGVMLFEKGTFSHAGPYDSQVRQIFSLYKEGSNSHKINSSQITHEYIPLELMRLLGFNSSTDEHFSEFVVGSTNYFDVAKNCQFVRSNEWKLIKCSHSRMTGFEEELYNLKEDPHETKNLIEVNIATAQVLKNRIGRMMK